MAVLVALAFATWLHPALGIAAVLVLVAIALKLALWSYRLSTLATVFSWDLLTFRSDRSWGYTGRVRAFSGKAIEVPKRTMGHLVLGENGSIEFVYRLWVIGPRRTLAIDQVSLELARTLTHPCLIRRSAVDSTYGIVARLPPRYRKRSEELAKAMGVPATDVGVRAAWRWCKDSYVEWRARNRARRTAAA